jgi:hemoglobin
MLIRMPIAVIHSQGPSMRHRSTAVIGARNRKKPNTTSRSPFRSTRARLGVTPHRRRYSRDFGPIPIAKLRDIRRIVRSAYDPGMESTQTLYDAAGGMAFFEALVDRFYDNVARDPVLLAVYPEPDDLSGARHRLTLFLAQYWGGPTTYNAERGHPRLRMRHFPFAIDAVALDAWLLAMREAIAFVAPPAEVAARLEQYFATGAEAMRNS